MGDLHNLHGLEMSFGRPANSIVSVGATPPDRGSFPLDHDGECKNFMLDYIKCMRGAKGQSTACRRLAKSYLGCRMDRGLMERVSWSDLGFNEDDSETASDMSPPQEQQKKL